MLVGMRSPADIEHAIHLFEQAEAIARQPDSFASERVLASISSYLLILRWVRGDGDTTFMDHLLLDVAEMVRLEQCEKHNRN